LFVCYFQASRSVVGKVKRRLEDSDEDDIPLMARKKIKKESKKRREESDEEEFKPVVSYRVLIAFFLHLLIIYFCK
jgi:hypothetical protein